MTTLQSYIRHFIKERDITARELSRASELSHQVINNIVNDDTYRPTLETLNKLSEGTKTPVLTLMRMSYPELFEEAKLGVTSELVAQAFEDAPQHIQDVILTLVKLK